jgi:hypothetical protein
LSRLAKCLELVRDRSKQEICVVKNMDVLHAAMQIRRRLYNLEKQLLVARPTLPTMSVKSRGTTLMSAQRS